MEPVPSSQRSLGIYSVFFIVPKKKLSWRAVLNLKFLNRFVRYRKFKMETLKTIMKALNPKDFVVSISLTGVYLQMSVTPWDGQYLRFIFG